MRPRVAQDGGWPLKRSRRQPTEADRLLNVGRRYGNRLLHYQAASSAQSTCADRVFFRPDGGLGARGRSMKKTWQKTSEPNELHALEGQFIALADVEWLRTVGF